MDQQLITNEAQLANYYSNEINRLEDIEQPNEQEKEEIQKLEVKLKLLSIFDTVSKNFPEIKRRCTNASIALSKFKKIESDEEDEVVESVLVKVRTTYQHCNMLRKESTSLLDELKEEMMEPERLISALAGDKEKSLYLEKKSLRDSYAAEKYKKQQEEQARILKEKNAKEEKIRLTAFFETAFFENITNAINNTIAGIENYYNSLTLQDFEEKTKRFSMKPVLKQDVFESWFKVDFNSSKLSGEEFDTLIKDEIRTKYIYNTLNDQYVKQVEAVMLQWKEKLPAKKSELQSLEELRKTNAEEAAHIEQQNKEAQKRDADALAEKQEADRIKRVQEIEQNQRTLQLEANFDAQVQVDQMVEQEGIRKKKVAIIDVPQAKIVDTFARVLFACFQNKKFEGYLKTDKSGNLAAPDENGNPVYTKWAEELLSFYAQYCIQNIQGITIKEVITTVQKKK